MRTREVSPCGSWKSPIKGSILASGSSLPAELTIEGDRLYWVQLHPEEDGRYGLYTWAKGEKPHEVVPREFNVRTRVHEYGGGSYAARGSTIYFSNFKDQLVYRLEEGRKPVPITKEGFRYADYVSTKGGTDSSASARTTRARLGYPSTPSHPSLPTVPLTASWYRGTTSTPHPGWTPRGRR